MPISTPTVTRNGLEDYLETYFDNSDLVAFLINDTNGQLTVESTTASIVGLELAPANGYTRKLITMRPHTVFNMNNVLHGFVESDVVRFTASGGLIPLFTHVCIAKDTSTAPGDTSGKILRIEPVNDVGVMLRDGESYNYQYEVTMNIEYD